MISRGFRSQTCVEVTSLLVAVWILTNVQTGGTETVEIVTPENTRVTTTETTLSNTSPSGKNLTVEWTGSDSYLQAYREVHKLQGISKRNDPTVLHERPAKKRQDPSYDTLIRSSYVPDDKYPSLTHHQHWMPAHPHSPPFSYGSFSHPPMHYHDDTPTRTCHGMPYSSPSTSFLPLLPKKLTLKLLLKIILKLVLFKMIVKFIAVICLLLFIPLLNSKETKPEENDGEEKRKARQLDMISNLIWDSISEKNSVYGQDDEMDDIERIAEEADEEPSDSGLEKAVRFLQFCVSAVDRAVLFLLGYLKRQRNEEDDLATFFLEHFNSLVSLCLKLLDLRVPQLIDVRDEALLKCKFDLGGDELYSVKWYKEELEFFRYMPDNSPRVQTFPVDGVHVVESKSNVTVITLSPLEYKSSGVYRCEVSSERPHFKTVYKSENMSVMGLPRSGPVIEGIKETYFLGDYVTGNCTSSPSNPAAQIQWFINEKKAEDWYLEYYNPPRKKEEFNLESRVLGLRFQVDLSHYQGKNQILSLTCQSTVAGKTKTQRVSVHLSRMMTNQKFAQEQINGGWRGKDRSASIVSILFLVVLTVHYGVYNTFSL